MNSSSGTNCSTQSQPKKCSNQNIQVYVRVRPLNSREKLLRSAEVIDVISPREIVTRHSVESKLTKKFTFDRTFGPESKQVDVYSTVVAPLIEEVLSGYNCTVFAYGQTGTGKTHTMVGTECAELKSSWEDDSDIGIIPRALCHLFDELRMMEMEFSMRISYLELYNEELCDLLSSDDSTKIRIFDDSTKKGSVIIQGLEEIPVHSKDDVYKLLEKGKERCKTATTLMNAQSSRSHTVFSILVHIRENGMDGEEMLKIGKLNLVDLAGSENVSKAGNEKGVRVRETVNINQSLLTLGRVITALVERTPHVPYRESKLTRLLQESLGGRTKTSIIATISPGHKDIDETLSTLEYAHRAKNIQNKPEVNQKLTKKVILKEYTEEIDKLKRDLMAARDKNGIFLAEETYNEMTLKMDSQNRELNEKVLLLKALKDELQNKEKIFNEVSLNLVEKAEALLRTEKSLQLTKGALQQTKKVLTTTKKRYKEKKVLLDSHVKTEEELTNQATQILLAADMAADDTHKLLTTIERRKDVDMNIQKACNRFSQLMHDNISLMNGNLSHLQDSHRSYSQIIVDEFKNAMTLQSHVVTNANNEIEKLKGHFDKSLDSLTAICEKFKGSICGLSDNHMEQMTKFFEELRTKQIEMALQIKSNLNELESYNDDLKIGIDKTRNHISLCMRRNMNDVATITKSIQEQLRDTTKLTQMNLEGIVQLETTIMTEKNLVVEEENTIKEFVDQMNALRKKRLTMATEMGNIVTGLNAKCTKAIVILQDSSANASNFCQKQCDTIKAEENLSRKAIDDILLCVDRSVAKCSSVQIQVDNQSVRNSELLDGFIKAETNQHTKTLHSCHDTIKEYNNMSLQSAQEMSAGFASIKAGITSDTDQAKRQFAVIEGVNTSLENIVEDYSKTYQTQISNCVNDVMKFKQCDLKTYAPTGTTPSKREYCYPRVLVATSPHDRIVKRFRQENDWSDLDTTAPIEEGSDEEGFNGESNSVCDISDAETLMNSTPIVQSFSDVISVNVKRGISNGRNSNTLRPPQCLHSTSSPHKASPRNSPALMKENEENVSC